MSNTHHILLQAVSFIELSDKKMLIELTHDEMQSVKEEIGVYMKGEELERVYNALKKAGILE